MPQMTNLLVKDDAATPIEVTLLPVSDSPDDVWRSNIDGVPLDGQIRYTLRTEVLKNGGSKTTAKLEVPVMETLGTAGTQVGYVAPPKVAHVTTTIITQFSDKRSVKQNRSDSLKMALGLAQGASDITATGILANTAAGSAFATTILPIPYAFVSVIKPS